MKHQNGTRCVLGQIIMVVAILSGYRSRTRLVHGMKRHGRGFFPTQGYIGEARGKFIQYKIIHRCYFTPSTLNRIGILNNDLCWKCGETSRTFIRALWECSKVLPLWENVVDYVGIWMNCELPRSPRLCLLEHRTMVPHLNKSILES